MKNFNEKLFLLLFCWLILTASILRLIFRGVVFMFKKGYWVIPVLIVVVTYFFLPLDDWKGYFKNHWESPVVEIQPKAPVECSYRNVKDNGFNFRIETCHEKEGVVITLYVDNEVVDKFLTTNTVHNDRFWQEYKKLAELKKRMYRKDM